MDATQRPIIFPPEFERYAEKHNIFQTFQLYLEHLILKRPEDPLQFLHNLLTSSIVDANKIIVLGPPTKERRELCKTLCGILKTVHITLELLEENSEKINANECMKRKKHKLKYIRGGKILKTSPIRDSPFHKTHKKAKIAVENVNQEKLMHEIKTESRIRFEDEKSEEIHVQLDISAEVESELILNKTESDITNKIIGIQYEEESVKETEQQEEEIKIELQEEEKMIAVSQEGESKTELQEEETTETEQDELTSEIGLLKDKTYQTEQREEETIEMELQEEEDIIRETEETKDISEKEITTPEETNAIPDLLLGEQKFQELEIKMEGDLDKEKAHEEKIAETILESGSHEHLEKVEILTTDFAKKSSSTEKFSEIAETKEHAISIPFYDFEKEIIFRKRSKLVVELMKQIETQTCKEQGWLVEGFPTTRLEGRALQQCAVFPTHVVILNYPSNYNFSSSITNEKEWLLYKNEISSLLDCYKHYYYRHFTLEQSPRILTDKILKFITNQPISNTPFTPRVLLLGLPGCGKTTQGVLLSERYDIINVDIKELIFQTIHQETPIGKSIKHYVQNDLQITDCLKAQAIAHRVSKRDALMCGYVLHGFPITVEQMEELNKVMKYRMPNRVIVIDISERTTYNRLNHRTNINYHHQQLSKSPTEDVHLLKGLINEQDSVKNRINTYLNNIERIEMFFQDCVIHIDGEMNIDNVSEAILNAIIHPLPKQYAVQPSSSEEFNMERLCKGLDCNLTL